MILWRRTGLRSLVSSVVLGSAALSGCMPQRVNLLQTGGASLQVEAPAHLRLAATVYAEPDRLVLYGTARAHSRVLWPIRGHVEIEILGPDRTLLATQQVFYRDVFWNRRTFRQATFKVTFTAMPPPGSLIILRHHDSAHEEMTDHDDHGHEQGP